MFFMIRSSKQDHTCLYLHDIIKKYFLILNNQFGILGINILTTQINNYFMIKNINIKNK